MNERPKVPRGMQAQAERLAKLLTYNCMRYTFLEDLHHGTIPNSKAGDYSDVKVVTPYGEIPWNKLSRISDDEMKKLNKEILNKVFTFLLHYLKEESLPIGQRLLWFPIDWDAAEIDPEIKGMWDRARRSENLENNDAIAK